MPQNADDEFLATCAMNGRTYPNDKVTEALGFKRYELGACEVRKRCFNSLTCPLGSKCVTNREVCLTKKYECFQRICVKDDDCLQNVCDEFGNNHATRCDQELPFRQYGHHVQIAYPGRSAVCHTHRHHSVSKRLYLLSIFEMVLRNVHLFLRFRSVLSDANQNKCNIGFGAWKTYAQSLSRRP